jgi:hypothetical protein
MVPSLPWILATANYGRRMFTVWLTTLKPDPKHFSDGLWHASDVVNRATTKARGMSAIIPQGLH